LKSAIATIYLRHEPYFIQYLHSLVCVSTQCNLNSGHADLMAAMHT
jgi:hypothetical protein